MRRKNLPVLSLACWTIVGLPLATHAQTTMTPGVIPENTAVGANAAPAQAATPAADTANEAAPKRAWTITPRIAVTETLTDNVLLRDSDKRSDQITQLSPGIRISGEGARTKLHFDYSRSEYFYAQDSSRKRSQNSLNAFGSLEAIEKWFYIDFNGVVAQQAISAFGAQSPSNASVNTNQTETSNFRISPYIRGRLAGLVDYKLGYSRSTMHSKSTSAFDVDTGEWSGRLAGSTAFRNLGWSLEASQQQVDYSNRSRINADSLRAILSYQIAPEYKVSVIAGHEANNYASLTKESHNTSGIGFDWTPSERTKLSLVREKRFFGDGHSFTFNHRTPHTAWRFTDSRNVSILPTQLATATLGTLYDLLFNQFESAWPDPTLRAQKVEEFLVANNLPANALVTTGFLSSSASLQRRRDFSVAWLGARNTLTFLATQSESERLQIVTGITDAFTNTSAIRQRGASLTLAHRFSPLSTLNVVGSRMLTSSGATGLDTNLRTLNITFSTKVGPHTSASLGARRALFDSSSTPYTENAVIGTLTAQF